MKALQDKTGVINPRLASRPTLRADCFKYQRAYAALNNAREFNQAGLQPIQVSEVKAYTELADIEPGYPSEKLLRIIQRMDATHLEWQAKKAK